MRVIVCADDGDQIAIDADDVATEQAVIRLAIENPTYNETLDFEGVTLTTRRARELASALLTIAEAIERYHSRAWREHPLHRPLPEGINAESERS
jgi:hypothetical protein